MRFFTTFILSCLLSVFLSAQPQKIDSLWRLLRKQPPDAQKPDILNRLCYLYSYVDNDSAIAIGNRALALSEFCRDSMQMGKAAGNLGRTYMEMGNHELGMSLLFRSLRIFERIKDEKRQALALNTIAVSYEMQRLYMEAIRYGLKSLPIHSRLKNVDGETESLLNLGHFYTHSDSLDKAFDFSRRAVEKARSSQNYWTLGYAYNAMGDVFQKQQLFPKAIDCHEQYVRQHKMPNLIPVRGY
jgi:tetratricopeptide (TPR) repeat protein